MSGRFADARPLGGAESGANRGAAAAAASGGWTRAERGALLLGLMGAAAHLWRFRHPDFPVDDAWISFRFARNLLAGEGLVYNAGLPPVEGMTNLLWTLLSVIWIALWPEADPIGPARVVGGVFQLGAVGMIGAAARRLAVEAGATGARPALAVAVATGLAALSGSMAYHATSGLETGLWALLVAAGVERGIAGRSKAVGVLGALAFATRPEAGLFFPALFGWLALRGGGLRAGGAGMMVFLAGVAGVEAFRLLTYGALVPNTFHAKPPSASGAYLYGVRWLMLGGGGGLGLLALLPARRHRALLGLVVLAVLSFAGALATGGDWMPGLRRLTEAMVVLYVLAGAGVAVAVAWERGIAALGAVALGASSVYGIVETVDSSLYPTEFNARVGELLAHSPGVRSVATADIGRIGWTFPGEIFDFAGLVDRTIAAASGEHGEKEWNEAYFRERAPDVVLITTFGPPAEPGAQLELRRLDQPVEASMRLHGGYTPWAAAQTLPGVWLVVFTRDGVVLPESLWGKPDPALAATFLGG